MRAGSASQKSQELRKGRASKAGRQGQSNGGLALRGIRSVPPRKSAVDEGRRQGGTEAPPVFLAFGSRSQLRLTSPVWLW